MPVYINMKYKVVEVWLWATLEIVGSSVLTVSQNSCRDFFFKWNSNLQLKNQSLKANIWIQYNPNGLVWYLCAEEWWGQNYLVSVFRNWAENLVWATKTPQFMTDKSQIRDEVLQAGFAGGLCQDSHAEQSTHVTCSVKSQKPPTWASTARMASESLRINVKVLVVEYLETFHCCQTWCQPWCSIWQCLMGSCDPGLGSSDLLRLVSRSG